MSEDHHDEHEEDIHKEEPSDVPDVITNSDAHKTLEEDEEILFEVRAKIYRFDSTNKEWKERGVGQAKILKHKTNGRIRLLMRREKLFKICLNHFITPALTLQENKSNDKSWIWNCPADYSEEVATEEIFAIRFANVESTKDFKKHFEAAQAEMKKLIEQLQKEKATAPAPAAEEKKEATPAATPAAEEKKAE